jgi:oligopeptidase A
MARPFLTQDFHIRWSTLTPDCIKADIGEALNRAQARLDAVIDQDRGKMTFDTVVNGLDTATRDLNESWGLVQHLDSLCNSPALREAHNEMLAEVSAFFAKIPLNEHLWDLLRPTARQRTQKAEPRAPRALDECMEGFIQAGADLPADKKARMEEIESSSHRPRRSTRRTCSIRPTSGNSSSKTPPSSKVCRSPPSTPHARMPPRRASARTKSPRGAFTLEGTVDDPGDGVFRRRGHPSPSLGRHQRPSVTGAEHDNTDLVWKILRLRHEKAQIMDKANFADHVLAHRMAKNGRALCVHRRPAHTRARGLPA